MKNLMNLKFLARCDNVIFARSIAVGFLSNLDISLNVINEIKTAISEAVTNAIVHGYGQDSSQMVELTMEYDDQEIIITVSDTGIGIEDVNKAKEPLFSTKVEEERAGLGFTIMEVFMDQLEVESKLNEGTKVKMIKKYHESE